MTWYYTITEGGTDMDVYDHTGSRVTTLTNDGTGFQIPDDILDVMLEEFNQAMGQGQQSRALAIARDGAFENVEEGTPP